MRDIIRKLSLMGMIAFTSLSLTGCFGTLIHEDTNQELRTRMEENRQKVKEIRDNGFFTESQANNLTKVFDGMEADIIKALENPKSLTAIGAVSKLKGAVHDSCPASTLGSSVGAAGAGFIGDQSVGLSQDDINNYTTLASVDVWVLKKDIVEASLDNVIEAVAKYKETKNFSLIAGYFEPVIQEVKNEAGEVVSKNRLIMEMPPPIRLSDDTDLKCEEVCDAEYTSNATDIGSGNRLPEVDNTFNKDFVAYGIKELKDNNPKYCDNNDAGDGCKRDHVNKFVDVESAIPALAIKLTEMNQDFVDFIGGMGETDPNYLFNNDNGSVKMLVMNYPVSYINTVKKQEDGKYKADLRNSETTYINLSTGKLQNKSGVDTYTPVNQKDMYYYLDTRQHISFMQKLRHARAMTDEANTTEAGLSQLKSSFILRGTSKLPMNSKLKFVDEKGNNANGDIRNIETGAILLRDYTEIVYMPNVVPSEDWIATGRKIRFEIFEGDANSRWGRYVDNSGSYFSEGYMPDVLLSDLVSDDNSKDKFNQIPNDINEEVNDVTDKEEIPDNGAYVKSLNEDTGSVSKDTDKVDEDNGTALLTDDNNKTDLDSDGDGRVDIENYTDTLPTNYVSEIKAGVLYPNKEIAKVDLGSKSDERPELFGVKINKNMMDTKLYNNWMNSDDAFNSLSWWNEWLAMVGYNYRIDVNMVDKFFTGNYGYETVTQGKIQFNMDIIRKLQAEFEDNKIMGIAAAIRTLFIVVGVIAMFYGLLLVISWIFDINVPFGPRLLTIITFGRWVAVLDADDEVCKIGNKLLVDFKQVVFFGFIASCIGLMFTVFDGVGILLSIAKAFSSISRYLMEQFMG